MIDWQQNDLSELIEIWDQWGKSVQDGFVEKYGSLPYFLPIQIDKPLMEATLPFWDPSYRCFTFNQEDMTPTLEEYSVLLQIKPEASHRIYWKEQGKSRYRKRVYQILGFEDPKKIDDQGIPWATLKKHIMETNNQEKGKGRLIGCTQLIYIWLQSYFWGEAKVPRCPYSSLCEPVKEFLKVDWPKGITKNEWKKTFKGMIPENVTWKAPWMPVSAFVYKCGENPWVPLIGLWGAVS
ncbi:hypothetical protein REPUB_Repub02eG0126200 [Reevesia pubescens]